LLSRYFDPNDPSSMSIEPEQVEAESGDAESAPPLTKRLLKGCGCVTGLLVMGLGILIIGNFDSASWASALIAITVAVLVFALSGVNGIWES
jgi:uncharacterized membrane protein YqjE